MFEHVPLTHNDNNMSTKSTCLNSKVRQIPIHFLKFEYGIDYYLYHDDDNQKFVCYELLVLHTGAQSKYDDSFFRNKRLLIRNSFFEFDDLVDSSSMFVSECVSESKAGFRYIRHPSTFVRHAIFVICQTIFFHIYDFTCCVCHPQNTH